MTAEWSEHIPLRASPNKCPSGGRSAFAARQGIKIRIADFANGDITALPAVYSCFSGHDKKMICEAASVLEGKLKGLSPLQLISFLNQMGQCTSLNWYEGWQDISLSKHRCWLSVQAYFTVLAVGSAHPNGFFREKCLRELSTYGGVALPYLLLRANDWARPVRLLSLAFAEEILQTCCQEAVFDALPYFCQLERCRRRSEADYARLMELAEKRLAAAPMLLTPQIALQARYSLEKWQFGYQRADSYTLSTTTKADNALSKH